MMFRSAVSVLLLFICCGAAAQAVLPAHGTVIRKSMKFRKSVYARPGHDTQHAAAIIIEGNNIVIDFNNATLSGSTDPTQPDRFAGTAIIIRNGKNITVRNAKARGYRIALHAENVVGLTIENCDFSYNYRQRLNSTQEKEDISDWMSYHHNEKDEWMRYGAAIYLRNCNNAVISSNSVTGGQNALMMTRCDGALIYNNNFSFNSGIGIGMYRCNNNRVLYNRINFNVRGYSHGVYHRGQDSAGILVYEQSNNNLFYRNSVTHGGDGFFLWAGQHTMDTGLGGCNDNVLLENDFSYAPTNGIEATFSRNRFTGNRIFECDHGVWGGYSYNTIISNNKFRDNRIAIAIEHGQENVIHHNIFLNDRTAIKLWARTSQPADWGYARARDTRSRSYVIAGNSFNRNRIVYDLQRTDSVAEFTNLYSGYDTLFRADSSLLGVDSRENNDALVLLSSDLPVAIPEVQKPVDPFRGGGKLAGRRNILMTEWGPYNFSYPLIWNTNPVDTSMTMEFVVNGPKGAWRLISARGVTGISLQKGTFPAAFTAQKNPGPGTDIEIVAEYSGPAFTDAFGRYHKAGKHRFTFRKFFQPVDFVVRWYEADTTVLAPGFSTTGAVALPVIKTDTVTRLDYAWWGGIRAGGRQFTQFLTIAEGTAVVEPGTYEIGVTWDDAVRVYLDDSLVLDEWNPSKFTFDESPHRRLTLRLGGNHRFRVVHFEKGGFATLQMRLKKLPGK